MGETKSLKTSSKICLVIHGFGTFGPIISKLVCELTFNPVFLVDVTINDGLIELVDQFKYLGKVLSSDIKLDATVATH